MISASLGPGGDKKDSHESENSSAVDEDDIHLDSACVNNDPNLNTSVLDDDDNKDTKRYESSCGEYSVAGRNDDWFSFSLSVLMLFVLIL